MDHQTRYSDQPKLNSKQDDSFHNKDDKMNFLRDSWNISKFQDVRNEDLRRKKAEQQKIKTADSLVRTSNEIVGGEIDQVSICVDITTQNMEDTHNTMDGRI